MCCQGHRKHRNAYHCLCSCTHSFDFGISAPVGRCGNMILSVQLRCGCTSYPLLSLNCSYHITCNKALLCSPLSLSRMTVSPACTPPYIQSRLLRRLPSLFSIIPTVMSCCSTQQRVDQSATATLSATARANMSS